MSLRSSLFFVPVLAGAHFAQVTAAQAEVPNVVADMAPIHSLVVQVMGDLAEPAVLMPQGTSPHGYALRPSDARAVQQADIVFWTGPKIEPWLDEVIDEIGDQTVSVPLATVEGVTVLDVREGATFERHMHDEDEHSEDAHDHDDEEHAEDDHDEHAHEAEDHEDHEEHDHDAHAEDAHEDHDDHDHAGVDDHAWLDPMNGRVWLGVIAEELAKLDAVNAETYRANAKAAQEALDVKIAEIQAELAPLLDMNFIVFHDAYNYFENRFGLSAAGSISISDATTPSPARIREIQNRVKEIGVTCVFSEPQFNAGLVNTVLDGTEAKSSVIDPLGVDLTPGAGFYGELMDSLAGAFTACAED
ncbi:zinc ABC transporter substrate-binding protein [Celeribacter sp. PS-C1]|uniref:zinc ABC transporter substrate-binding protein n=1 Tax=Celeribacter sp. PS-C1 TaxID=2820813 RepID=UPI001CA498FC|nr:zinc ABC transporter substrate-binding protein [Celeribacter sp. PS-C1]MBW6417853.1 zinc ABC transporter substrate-binding protein [Celeribacter sp. PS-C1]